MFILDRIDRELTSLERLVTATSSAKKTTDKGVKLEIILSYKKIVENKKQVNKHTAYYFLLTSSKITLPKSSGIDR